MPREIAIAIAARNGLCHVPHDMRDGMGVRTFWVPGLVVAILATWGCGYNGPQDTAKLNPLPVQTIEVDGTASRTFTVPQLRVTYLTDASAAYCNIPGHYEAPPLPLREDIFIPTNRRGNRVTATVQLDRYISGQCQWQMAQIWAVVRDKTGDTNQPLVAIGYGWYKDHALLGDREQPENTSTFHCGYKHGSFGCADGAFGDASHFPVEIKAGVRRAGFVLHDSGYPAPPGYQLPCRDKFGYFCSKFSP